MPYYHVHIVVRGKQYYEHNQSPDSIQKLSKLYNKGQKFLFSGIPIDPHEIGKIRIYETELRNEEIAGAKVWDVGINVTRRFIESPPSDDFAGKTLTKDVFIVHGRDHKPMKGLKTMLKDFGFNPIVLHEQPSGGRTIVEKLEKYSYVDYAFVILTPEDGLFNLATLEEIVERTEARALTRKQKDILFLDSFMNIIAKVARQNVILEFGYFMGLLGRNRVCCLHKGKVELPSDMQGIAYIPFKESVNEVRDKIIKELQVAGYEIKV